MTNLTDFSSVFAGLVDLTEAIERGAAQGLARQAQVLQADAQATTAYGDVTEATRVSTVAYVASKHSDGGASVDEALAAGDSKNPGKVLAEDAGEVGEDQIVVILTSMTTYAEDLETRGAGDSAFIAPTMDGGANALFDAACQGIAQELA